MPRYKVFLTADADITADIEVEADSADAAREYVQTKWRELPLDWQQGDWLVDAEAYHCEEIESEA